MCRWPRVRQVRAWILHETGATAHTAERVHDTVMLGEVACVLTVHGHPAHGVEQLDRFGRLPDVDGLRLLARLPDGWPLRLVPAGGLQRGRSGRCNEGRPTTPHEDELGENRQGYFLRGRCAEIDAGGCPERCQ